ncbi:Aaap amino acid permease [Mycena venus]|uniref:Aaap amino acid permease n=1 Tax=Mycena venus TaxID=2733690 RepID=A0A8H6Y902_9AGAR|nr:Aaap amino acid permease [Mycena venus]
MDRHLPDDGPRGDANLADIPNRESEPVNLRDFIILRRRAKRPEGGGGLKDAAVPSRFLNLSRNFEFAGWGSFSKIKLSSGDNNISGDGVIGEITCQPRLLGPRAIYSDRTCKQRCVYSPIVLFASTLTPFLWRPMMEELGSALPISGAPYSYLINVTRKSLALIDAALLLDFTASSVVSAATAASYLAGEVNLPFPEFVAAAIIVGIFALNWELGRKPSALDLARQLFYGFCLGMLGLTGLECTPSYIGRIKPGHYPLVLRNLHLPVIGLDTVMMVLVLATVPLPTLLAGADVLSALAEVSAGRWMRRWVVADAIVVLCGGVLIGILGVCELLKKLAHDRIVPQAFLNVLRLTDAPYISVLAFMACNVVMYGCAGGSLSIVSQMFSLVWLTVMGLFPIALLLLRFNRGRLPRNKKTPLSVIIASLVVTAAVFAGNVAIDPTTVGYFTAYLIGVVTVFVVTQKQVKILKMVYWTYDQDPALHRWSITKAWGKSLVGRMIRLKRQPICILVKTDEINHLLHLILYVRDNEETSCIKIVHFCGGEHDILSELEANAKILDEAFPEITIDLIIVEDAFISPATWRPWPIASTYQPR